MKALKPSHREHKRYLLISGSDASQESIEGAILKFIGILGYAKASPQFVKLEEKKLAKYRGKLVLAINRAELEKVRSALALSGKDIRIENVSGVLGAL